MKTRRLLWAVALCGLQAGCGEFALYGARNLFEAPLMEKDKLQGRCRFRRLAEDAWDEVEAANPGQEYSVHYARGFKYGFVDYLDAGGTGEPPVAPPWVYRSSRFETPEGRQDITDWFTGYRHGAGVARASGLRDLVVLPLALPPGYLDNRAPAPPGAPPGPPTSPEGGPRDVLPPPREMPRVPEGDQQVRSAGGPANH
jgi:hypothetical protein